MNVEIKDSLYALFAGRKMDGVVLKSFGNDEVLSMLKSVKRKDIVYVFNMERYVVVFLATFEKMNDEIKDYLYDV